MGDGREVMRCRVPCKKKRHTAEHIGELSDAAWASSGLRHPVEDIFVRVSDNGANMIKGWSEGFQSPCLDHTLELSVKQYTDSDGIEATICKGRGIVGYFNSSVAGSGEEVCGLAACQRTASLPPI
ncbi:hypothetical protein AB1Y20_015697 [Prymnesium parvum]|uniref:Uncharacterized protein n=1 Tax=Prymnesium parvum TaxID=97485 RepID=A0AB34JXH7_PRYPA|mmetsp:Transcript_31723/g.79059  ORF Transcript_31723/g.79059 Transcript_31723/m.79059 type:complete len:126 (+) Transcript_31723:1107-1484(+)